MLLYFFLPFRWIKMNIIIIFHGRLVKRSDSGRVNSPGSSVLDIRWQCCMVVISTQSWTLPISAIASAIYRRRSIKRTRTVFCHHDSRPASSVMPTIKTAPTFPDSDVRTKRLLMVVDTIRRVQATRLRISARRTPTKPKPTKWYLIIRDKR